MRQLHSAQDSNRRVTVILFLFIFLLRFFPIVLSFCFGFPGQIVLQKLQILFFFALIFLHNRWQSRKHACTHARAHTHTHTDARTHTHGRHSCTHTHTHTHTIARPKQLCSRVLAQYCSRQGHSSGGVHKPLRHGGKSCKAGDRVSVHHDRVGWHASRPAYSLTVDLFLGAMCFWWE